MSPLCSVPHDVVDCCMPDILDTNSAVPVLCSNPLCWQSGLVHPGCFYKWEDMVVRFLVSGERMGSGTDTQVANMLWTKQMWDLPLPVQLTACQCGVGSLKRNFGNQEHFTTEGEVRGSVSEGIVQLDSKGNAKLKSIGEEYLDKIDQYLNEPSGDTWETVSRSKSKKKMSNVTDTIKKKEKLPKKKEILSPKKQLHDVLNLQPGPDPYVPPFHPKSQAEGKRDSSGLIHCCSCQTVHASLPDFLQHCKTAQHCQLQERSATEVGEKDDNNNVVEEIDLRREVDQLKSCLLELMKQRLEQDGSSADKCVELRENFKLCMEKNRGTLAFLIEKFQGMEEKINELNNKMSSCFFKVENNEKDLDSCFDCIQDLKDNMAEFTKEIQKKNMVTQEQDEIDVKISESKERTKLEVKVVNKKDKVAQEIDVNKSVSKERSRLKLTKDVDLANPGSGNCPKMVGILFTLLLLAFVWLGFVSLMAN
eukprot:GFUD01019179.1.p1 GENE.GFUD01019179.1~~GFUD01019179.1.p1  ORF type:complete len:478 (+),score=164.82 GFUD01019179.1:141-1574(+)